MSYSIASDHDQIGYPSSYINHSDHTNHPINNNDSNNSVHPTINANNNSIINHNNMNDNTYTISSTFTDNRNPSPTEDQDNNLPSFTSSSTYEPEDSGLLISTSSTSDSSKQHSSNKVNRSYLNDDNNNSSTASTTPAPYWYQRVPVRLSLATIAQVFFCINFLATFIDTCSTNNGEWIYILLATAAFGSTALFITIFIPYFIEQTNLPPNTYSQWDTALLPAAALFRLLYSLFSAVLYFYLFFMSVFSLVQIVLTSGTRCTQDKSYHPFVLVMDFSLVITLAAGALVWLATTYPNSRLKFSSMSYHVQVLYAVFQFALFLSLMNWLTLVAGTNSDYRCESTKALKIVFGLFYTLVAIVLLLLIFLRKRFNSIYNSVSDYIRNANLSFLISALSSTSIFLLGIIVCIVLSLLFALTDSNCGSNTIIAFVDSIATTGVLIVIVALINKNKEEIFRLLDSGIRKEREGGEEIGQQDDEIEHNME